MSFSAIGLSAAVMQGVAKSGYSSPTEIQRKAIPLAIAGKDIIGCAPTGTGKTAAFVLPILDRLQQKSAIGQHHRFPRALILTPTRELAQQIDDSIRIYGKFTGFRSLSVYGGVGIGGQLSCLRQGIDIVVATPGRLLDHLERNSIDLSHIEFLVLDEADRMFDMGFINAVRAIIARSPKSGRRCFFRQQYPGKCAIWSRGYRKIPCSSKSGNLSHRWRPSNSTFSAFPSTLKRTCSSIFLTKKKLKQCSFFPGQSTAPIK